MKKYTSSPSLFFINIINNTVLISYINYYTTNYYSPPLTTTPVTPTFTKDNYC